MKRIQTNEQLGIGIEQCERRISTVRLKLIADLRNLSANEVARLESELNGEVKGARSLEASAQKSFQTFLTSP